MRPRLVARRGVSCEVLFPGAGAARQHYVGLTVEMDAFAAMTQRVIADQGFAEHLPTACYPQRRVVRVLEDAPSMVDLESVALDWALAAAEGDEEMLVAFKISTTHFKVVRRAEGRVEQCVYPATITSASEHS